MAGMLVKGLDRLQLWDSHLTHETVQENSKVGVWGEAFEVKEMIFAILWESVLKKYKNKNKKKALKLFFQKTQNCI